MPEIAIIEKGGFLYIMLGEYILPEVYASLQNAQERIVQIKEVLGV